MAFYFEKPAGFEFKAGQFLNFTLIDPPETDGEGICARSRFVLAPLESRTDLLVFHFGVLFRF